MCKLIWFMQTAQTKMQLERTVSEGILHNYMYSLASDMDVLWKNIDFRMEKNVVFIPVLKIPNIVPHKENFTSWNFLHY